MDATVRALMALARVGRQLNKFDRHNADEAAVLAELVTWFASKEAIAATELPERLIGVLVKFGLARRAVVQVGKMVLAKPLTGRSRHGSPRPFEGMPSTRRVASEEPEFRARYVLAATRRLTAAVAADEYEAVLARERHYLDLHVAAGRGRRAAARRVDQVAATEGPLLVWRTKGDRRVDPRCAAMEGRLFTADHPPDGLLPGTVHPKCRCFAVGWGGQLFR